MRPVEPYAMVPMSILRLNLSPMALRVWIVMARFAGMEEKCWPSNDTLAEVLNSERRSVIRAKKELEAIGLVRTERRFGPDGRETSCLYTVLQPDGQAVGGRVTISSPRGDTADTPEGDLFVTPEGDETVTRSRAVGREQKEETRRSSERPSPAQPKDRSDAQQLIAHYVKLWREQYHGDPPLGGREHGQLAQIAKKHGWERGRALIEAFFDMQDEWVQGRAHDVGCLWSRLSRLVADTTEGAVADGPGMGYVETINGKARVFRDAREAEAARAAAAGVV